jgi:predicted hotdog family 3-hydroxylacyl-ACP dehydratase
MQLDRAWIERHIPHQGSMCLLDAVIERGAEHISCRTGTHRAADNPLRSAGRLGAACGIEYAAQTMAVHGALASSETGVRAEAGFLAGLRDVRLHVLRLDDIEDDLVCHAARIAGDAGTALYEFGLWAGARSLLSGRAMVLLDANKHLLL